MDEKDKSQQNMISNLPLLFANGYPTSLEKITEPQLENFIPFMVQCSLGHINLPKKIDCSEPEWWPENAPFGIPLKKPKHFVGSWMDKMKEIVVICYQFHKSLFLLRFCNDLASYEHASLRFINNYNSTTSLYDRRNNKLLVTFRNENMSYDRQQKSRKCLLLQKNLSDSHNDNLQHMMVEPPPFDIYLCDNCDAELYSKEAILEHENICNMEDDVILCDSPEPDNKCESKNENNDELRNEFLLNFCLQSKSTDPNLPTKHTQKPNFLNEELVKDTSSKNRRMSSRRNRNVHSFNRCSFIPVSSPAGQQLLKSTKQPISLEYVLERFERLDRFCYTPLVVKSSCKQKPFEKKSNLSNVHCTFKKSHEHNLHIYSFPRRQFAQRRDTTQNFLFLNSPLIKQCRPISVRLKKISDNATGEPIPITNTKLNIRLTRDTSLNSHWRISPSSEVIVDTIDLCSSDDEEQTTIASTPQVINSDGLTIISVSHKSKKAKRTTSCDDNAEPESTSIRQQICKNITTSTSISPDDPLAAQSSCSTLSLSDDNSIKPLQQSVYIFSNYKTNSVFNRCAVDTKTNVSVVRALNTTNTFTSESSAQPKEHNQENCSSSSSSMPKKLIAVTDWYAHHHTTNSDKGSINQTDNIAFENISVVQPFNSTGRIISIDLTT
ncbi:uncharacterized protein ova [Drosophila tropicalis]|uniref:uncharacterized protein ova n=1 Tax=Drosophila tropicalis TaxID=46794 RepID=UPI0035ABD1DF